MSWSNQDPTSFQESTDLKELKWNYADAELAYHSLKREYSDVLKELNTTKMRVDRIQRELKDTQTTFNDLKQEMDGKTQEVTRLISENERYFNQLDQLKQTMDQHVVSLVTSKIDARKNELIRMDRFTEYFPTLVSLIALAAILFFIFRT